MDMRREDVREPVERQRGLMRDETDLIGPEPGDDQFFVAARWEVDQPVDASASPGDPTRAVVLEQQL
jgi:hypothetical protein